MRDWIFNARKEKCRRDSGQRTMQAGSMGETSWRAIAQPSAPFQTLRTKGCWSRRTPTEAPESLRPEVTIRLHPLPIQPFYSPRAKRCANTCRWVTAAGQLVSRFGNKTWPCLVLFCFGINKPQRANNAWDSETPSSPQCASGKTTLTTSVPRRP